jgi:PAS domain S-box-containing protein
MKPLPALASARNVVVSKPSRRAAKRKSSAEPHCSLPARPQTASPDLLNAAVADSALYRASLDNLEIAVAHVQPDGRLIYANPRFAEMFGRPLWNLAGVHLRTCVSHEGWASLSSALQQAITNSIVGTVKVLAVDPDSSDRVIRLSFSPLFWEQVTIQLVGTEVTEQLQTEQALEKTEASLKTMSIRLLQIQDEERRRLARELHDTSGQELAVIIMSLDRVAAKLKEPAAESSKAIGDCSEQLRKLEGELRTLSYVLHPPLLDDMGLGAALRWYIEGFVKRTGIEVDADIPNPMPRFELDKETALFRVIQESLRNVYRHSGSRRARVRVSANARSMEARVEDEGHGFAGASGRGKQKPGVGLQSMRGRLEIVGGTLDVHSGPHGTCVTARVAIQTRDAEGALDSANGAPETAETGKKYVPKRILIADDHEVARRGIRILFEGQDDLEICGEASDGLEAVKRTKELKPDLVILDLSMPKMGGLVAAGQIRKEGLESKIIVYTSHALPQLERTAQLAGCDGYVTKSDATRDLLRATREVLGGAKFYRSERNAKSRTA